MSRRALAPIFPTCLARTGRAGRMQVWAAMTRDGRWVITRTEHEGTPWVVRRVWDARIVALYGTLADARAAIAAGHAEIAADERAWCARVAQLERAQGIEAAKDRTGFAGCCPEAEYEASSERHNFGVCCRADVSAL